MDANNLLLGILHEVPIRVGMWPQNGAITYLGNGRNGVTDTHPHKSGDKMRITRLVDHAHFASGLPDGPTRYKAFSHHVIAINENDHSVLVDQRDLMPYEIYAE